MPRGIPKKRQDMQRNPAGMPRKKLTVADNDPNKRLYWATPSQFQELQDAGYTFVTNNDHQTGDEKTTHPGSRVTAPASKSNDEKLYLMEIPKKWYEENQKIKEGQIKAREDEMFNRGDTDTTYTVKGTRKDSEIIR